MSPISEEMGHPANGMNEKSRPQSVMGLSNAGMEDHP